MDLLDTSLLDVTLLGNPVRAWLTAVGASVLAFLALRLALAGVQRKLGRVAARTPGYWDDVAAAALGGTRSSLLLFVALAVGVGSLTLPPRFATVLRSVAVIAVLVQAGIWLNAGLVAWFGARGAELAEEEPAAAMTFNVLRIVARIALWSMVVLLALDNLGVDVTALVAGLGIGGVAVALALQNILGDLFASLSVVLDKPFVLGDFLIVGDFLGSVEAIGLKTTRIRSLSGEQVVFSNADLLGSRIRNYGRMFERRVVLGIGVVYQTPRPSLARIPGMIREAIEAQGEDRVRFDRAHLDRYADFSIAFEAVYFVKSPDYNVHMDIKQDILLRIHAAFDEEEIDFAYPTQRLLLERAAA